MRGQHRELVDAGSDNHQNLYGSLARERSTRPACRRRYDFDREWKNIRIAVFDYIGDRHFKILIHLNLTMGRATSTL